MPTKILVVEDDKFLRRVYESKLAKEGFTVVAAQDGDEGFEALKRERPALVLLDLVMARKTGFDVLQSIKDDPDRSLSKIPVIVLSNLGQESDIARAKELGASEYLVKSNTPINAIVDKIKRWLSLA